MTIMRAMDGIRRGTRTRRLEEAAARDANGNGHAPPRPAADVDHDAFPDQATRLAFDGGAASAKFRALLDRGRADPRRRGDGHDAVRERPPVRRSARGLEPRPPRRRSGASSAATSRPGRGSCSPTRSAATGSARAAAATTTASTSSTAPPRSCSGPRSTPPAATRSSPATSGRPARSSTPLGTLAYDEAVDIFREQAAVARRRRRRPHLDRDDVRPQRDQGGHRGRPRRPRPASPLVTTMTFDTRGHTMMGVSPEEAVEALAGWGADADRRQLRQRPGRAHPGHRARCTPPRPDVVLVAKSNAGHARARRHAGRLPRRPRDDGRRRPRDARRGRHDRRRAAAAARPTTSARWRPPLAAHA